MQEVIIIQENTLALILIGIKSFGNLGKEFNQNIINLILFVNNN